MKLIARGILLTLLFTVLPLGSVHAQQGVKIIPDVVYGHKDGLALTFDVFKPETRANGAAVLFMVSGGWISRYTAPETAIDQFRELLDKGFTVFSVRHGGSPRYVIPEVVEDVRRAVRFVRLHAKDWNIDSERMGVYGGSAGGHLSLMLGTASDKGDPNAKEDVLRVSDRIAAVVAYYPPVDLRRLVRGADRDDNDPGLTPERFPALGFDKDKASDYSPLLHVTSDDAPTLLIHGDKDELVNLRNSNIILEALKKNNVQSKLIVIPGAGHGFRGDDLHRATEATVAWFEEQLTKKTSSLR